MTLFDSIPPETRERAGVRGAPEKAATGPGVAMIQFGTQLSALSRSPQKKMAEAAGLADSNPWIHSAEMTVTRRVAGMEWHLEDENDEEIEDTATGPAAVVTALFEKPQAAVPDLGWRMTWRDLLFRTSWHMGVCGVHYWYLDQMDAAYKFPMGILPVDPWRVWPVISDGGFLTGWVLDPKDDTGRGGTPLDVNELIPFYLVPPGRSMIPSGLVEVAGLKAKITDLADRHAAFVLGTGGRLAGIISPKDGILNDDQYQRLVREYRNLVEAPDAAKRLTITQGPIDYTQTAATPSELALLDLSAMNRDDIFAVWGVPPSLAGVPSAGGLNSGETRKYDEAILMQGAVHDRIVAIRETIQYRLLDRLGNAYEFEFEEPEFDDDAPAYEIASKARELPLTNKERRSLVGLDPFGKPEIDEAVWLPVGLTEAYPGSPDGPAAAPEPQPPILPQPPVVPPETPELPEKAGPLDKLRTRIEKTNVPAIERAVAKVIAEQRDEIIGWLREHAEHVVKKPTDTRWWNAAKWDKRLAYALAPFYTRTADLVYGGVASTMGRKADPVGDAIRDAILRRSGERITGINGTTRDMVLDAIRAAVALGFGEGESPAVIADRVAEAAAFDQYRAERIARTETMWSYNTAALESYKDFGVEYVEASDGDEDPECAERDGRIFTLDEAEIETAAEHPNGTLGWAPVVGYDVIEVPGKAADVNEADVRRIVAEMVKAGPPDGAAATIVTPVHVYPQFSVAMPQQEAPVVVNQVNVPEQAAPQVTVNVPEQKAEAPVVNVTVPEQKASVVQDIRIVGQPVVRNTVIRDKAGQMIGTVEEPIE